MKIDGAPGSGYKNIIITRMYLATVYMYVYFIMCICVYVMCVHVHYYVYVHSTYGYTWCIFVFCIFKNIEKIYLCFCIFEIKC